KRLATGKAVGVDLWQAQDQSGNSSELTLQNVRAEGLEARVEIKTADARQLPFESNTFDLVLSSWALHNIYDPPGREKALREIILVLKPGSRAIIIDIRHTAEYARVFKDAGFNDLRRFGPHFVFFIPSFTLQASRNLPRDSKRPSI